MHIHLAPTYFW